MTSGRLDPEDVRAFAARPWNDVEAAQLALDDVRYARLSPAEWCEPLARWTVALSNAPVDAREARERDDLEHHLLLTRLLDALARNPGGALG
jgi:hypothetical protein